LELCIGGKRIDFGTSGASEFFLMQMPGMV
jgi:hypothetical protein